MQSDIRCSRFYAEPSKQRADVAMEARAERNQNQNQNPGHSIVIIGAGMIGREHMRVATLLGRAKVYGLFDIHSSSMDKAEEAFRSYSDSPLVRYDSLKAACSDSATDVIFICTPNFTHFEVLRTAITSGKAIFLEKPMATSLADAAEIIEMVSVYREVIQIGMQYRYKAQYTDAFHEVYAKGTLGEVKTISMSEYRPPFLDKVEQWNKFNSNSGGTLVEKCCHYFDLINLMANSRPKSVVASGGQAVNFLNFEQNGVRSDVDDHGFVIVEYENGIRTNFTLNMFCPDLVEELVVCGEKGRLVATESSSFVAGISSKAAIKIEVQAATKTQPNISADITYPSIVEESGHHGATYFEHEALMDQLDGQETDSATPLQGLWAMVVASAAQESISSGTVINIKQFIDDNQLTEKLDL